jgi:hypothetical protein
MLHGKGTVEDPMLSASYRYMDALVMEDLETNERRMVIIVEHKESADLLAIAFEIDDASEMATKILKEIADNG